LPLSYFTLYTVARKRGRLDIVSKKGDNACLRSHLYFFVSCHGISTPQMVKLNQMSMFLADYQILLRHYELSAISHPVKLPQVLPKKVSSV